MGTQVRDKDSARPATPRWVKVLAAIGLIAVVAILVMVIIGGDHGPGRHTGSSQEGHQAPAGVPHP
jgi:hypothetical protein